MYLWQFPPPLRGPKNVVLALDVLLSEKEHQLAVANEQSHMVTILLCK